MAANGILANTVTNFVPGDVLICFRKGGVDMVVDAGPISTFTNLSVNQSYTITQYTGSQLAQVGTNGISWSAFTYLSDNTLFVTKPRSSVISQTTPWTCKSSSTQAGAVGRIVTIPPGAVDEFNLLVYPQSTSTAVIEEDISSGNANYTDGVSYHEALAGSFGGNFNGTFQGNPENTTSNNFTTKATVIRSDFYQMTPTSGFANGKWLGYFELNTNGIMKYVAYPTSTPTMASIGRAGNNMSINYTTGSYGTYSLRGTNNMRAPLSTWPVIMTLNTGDNATHTASFTDTDPTKYYTISAQ